MVEADLQGVISLENENPSPWSKVLLAREMEFIGGLQFVAEETADKAAHIVAWCACRVIPPEAELLKIAVSENDRRTGLGRLLLEHLLVELSKRQIDNLFLEVRSQNQVAISFYKKNGFVQAGIRPNYYQDPSDDGLLLQKEL